MDFHNLVKSQMICHANLLSTYTLGLILLPIELIFHATVCVKS